MYVKQERWDCYVASMRNRPFPSSLKPLFQSEAECEAIDLKIIFFTFTQIKLIYN